ncbi:hypothetical protein WBG99_16425 [Streptomyces sp. TG1A-60]|uniref:hypothetical protein n=1 Tax=Streptomyces sp. TG1A-60 TaxID=3129111 RepID=UPI0030D3BB57
MTTDEALAGMEKSVTDPATLMLRELSFVQEEDHFAVVHPLQCSSVGTPSGSGRSCAPTMPADTPSCVGSSRP